jgi:3-phosphoshikimate 1-carboxyvinyltransferase
MLRSLGVEIESTLWDSTGDTGGGEPTVTTRLVPPRRGQSLPGFNLRLPGDPSAAAFLVVAALITPGSRIRLEGVLLNPTRTGLLDALQAMQAKLTWQATGEMNGEPVGWIEATFSELGAIEVSGPLVVRMIDEFPAFAIAAACATGVTTVREATELRTKESDRITALVGELQKIGVSIRETPDGFEINGGRSILGGIVEPQGDHRLAMALAVAGLRADSSITVRDSQLIAESFPTFTEILGRLGGEIEIT